MQPLNQSVTIDSTDLRQVDQHKHLGVTFNDHLTWKDNVHTISTTTAKKIGFLRRYQKPLPQTVLQHIYKTSIRPALEYSSVAWTGLSTTEKQLLERIQRKAERLITDETTRYDIPHDILLSRAGLATLSSRHEVEQIVFAFNFLHNLPPDHVLDKLMHWNQKKPERSASLQHSNQFVYLFLTNLFTSDLLYTIPCHFGTIFPINCLVLQFKSLHFDLFSHLFRKSVRLSIFFFLSPFTFPFHPLHQPEKAIGKKR